MRSESLSFHFYLIFFFYQQFKCYEEKDKNHWHLTVLIALAARQYFESISLSFIARIRLNILSVNSKIKFVITFWNGTRQSIKFT